MRSFGQGVSRHALIAAVAVAVVVGWGPVGASAASLTWSAPITLGAIGDLTDLPVSVSCPTAMQCTAVDYYGERVTFNPTNPGRPTRVTIAAEQVDQEPIGVACPSTRQCTAVDQSGLEVTFDPVAPRAKVHSILTGGFLQGVSCPSTTQCIAIDEAGHEWTFNPTGSVRPSPSTIDPGVRFASDSPDDERGLPVQESVCRGGPLGRRGYVQSHRSRPAEAGDDRRRFRAG